MKSREQTSVIQHSRSYRFDMRLLLSVVLSFSVFLAQSVPAMADHGTDISANWVEICGDGGSYFIQIGEDGQEQTPKCAHCDYCLTAVGDMQAAHSDHHSGLALKDFSNISFSSDQAALPDNPEQYWSACRGPPIVSVENKMTTNTSLTLKELIVSAFSARSIPCA